MTLVGIVVVLVVVGLILWLINTYIPMAGAIKSLLNIVVFVFYADMALTSVWCDWSHQRTSHSQP